VRPLLRGLLRRRLTLKVLIITVFVQLSLGLLIAHLTLDALERAELSGAEAVQLTTALTLTLSTLSALLIIGWTGKLLDVTLQRLLRLTGALMEGEEEPVRAPWSDWMQRLSVVVHTSRELERQVGRLAARRDQFEAVLESMREGVVALDAEHRVLLANQSACELFAWRSPPLGEPIDALLKDDALSRFLREERAEAAPWVELSLSDQRTLLARLTQGHSSSPANEERDEVLVISDITALRKLETVRRDFVANVSHELRTPTTIIQANAETLVDGAMEDPEQAAIFLDGIYRHSQRLAHLVSDLLDLSRIESGAYQLKLGWCQLSPVVERVIDSLADQIIAKELKITLKLNTTEALWVDEGALEQVLTNLVENAVKYSDARSKVLIKSTPISSTQLASLCGDEPIPDMISQPNPPSQSYVLLEVSDNGPGIPQEHHARLFERFYRVDTGRSRQQGGTGLGLSIVKHLVSAMGGAVGIHPTSERGSAFWVTLRAQGEPSQKRGVGEG
jgi:two-component system phosphate regulon sensor histidine kinase PhoR